jgi:hypothetical protein
LLAVPFTVTTTLPVVAPEGTFATIDESVQLAAEAVVTANVTVPGVAPKFDPVIVTDAPTTPEDGDRLAMVGVGGGGVTIDRLDELPPQPNRQSTSTNGTNRVSAVAPKYILVKELRTVPAS